jgi:hypothetical protein
MAADYKRFTDFLLGVDAEKVPHSGKTYLGHLIAVYRLMESVGCSEELCRAGMFHSIYGTERFQKFKLPVERRAEVRALIGERAERLAYLNCAVDRASFDQAIHETSEPWKIIDRLSGDEVLLSRQDFDDLCRVHLYDWLEQVPRSVYGWDYRRAAYRRMAERLDEVAVKTYDRVFSQEGAVPATN